DTSVDPQLAVGLAAAFQQAAVSVQHQQVVLVGQPGAAPRGKEEAVRAGDAGAHVAKSVGQVKALDDAVGDGYVVAQLRMLIAHLGLFQTSRIGSRKYQRRPSSSKRV